ncbi:hypothetical protein BKA65DRAFT_592029 [Rhexocercosporidium sp. MPI-PUGE-AT-0058]|nr:hypothetical protein BKA65DRAFT_592029 [Rhexocercosporidium sp. MPI-PUGE-AT-0058]
MGTMSEPQSRPTFGTFRYISKGIKPTPSTHFYHLPTLAEFGDVRHLPMTDIRYSLNLSDDSPYKLSTHGFTAHWNNETLLTNIYIPEVETLVKSLTGAKTVFTDQLVMRNNLHTEVDGLAREETGDEMLQFPKMVGTRVGSGGSPAPKVHLDYAPQGARTHLRKYHPKTREFSREVVEAEDRLLAMGVRPEDMKDRYDGPRWAMFSVWRPLKTVLRDPLALSDCRSFPVEDYVEFSVVFPTGVKDGDVEKGHEENVFLAYGSDDHEWYWISKQDPDEVFVIQLFDSDAERERRGVAGGVMHSSVSIQGTEEEDARESVEVRCIAIW